MTDFAFLHTCAAIEMTGCKEYKKFSNLMKWRETLSKLPYFEECVKAPVEANNILFRQLLGGGSDAMFKQ